MGGGGSKPVELRKVLLACEHELGGGERIRELARLLGDLPGMQADERDRKQDREPNPHDIEPGNSSGGSVCHGSGSCTKMSKVAQAIAKPPSIRVMRGGSAVAEIRTGPRNRNAKGFCSPPVKNNSTASSAVSKASSHAARSGSQPLRHREANAQRDIEPG